MTATDFFAEVDLPQSDIAPPTVDTSGNSNDYDPDYPGSTPDAPYGYKPDGTAYKRRPRGTGGNGEKRPKNNMPGRASAAQAAALLARLNLFVGMGLGFAGMPMAAAELARNNDAFEAMARESLEADPALCKKILSAGSTGGKTGLALAYLMLAGSTYPAMRDEYKLNHPKEVDGEVWNDGTE